MTDRDFPEQQKMKEKIDKIEKDSLELKEMGQGVPAIEKNCQSILSAVYILKFGISHIADMETEDGGMK